MRLQVLKKPLAGLFIKFPRTLLSVGVIGPARAVNRGDSIPKTYMKTITPSPSISKVKTLT
jgi:hypothetical protein